MSSGNASPVGGDYGKRNLSIVAFIGSVLVWLVIVKFVGIAVKGQAHVHDGRYLTIRNLVWALVVPLGAGCVFIYGLIAALGWWRPVFYDPKPVRRWVWCIPVIFIIVIVAGINYGGLADRGAGFTVMMLLVAMLIGFGEEGLFRAVGVTSLRRHGLSEGKVALWSAVIFGLAHVANLIGGDSKALGQAVIVSFAGYFFYLIRRVSRSNILNSVLHGMFDFTILSGTAIIPATAKSYPGAVAAILAYVICGVVLLIRRHKIEPDARNADAPTTNDPHAANA